MKLLRGNCLGPKGRQVIAPTVRSGYSSDVTEIEAQRAGTSAPTTVTTGVGPSGLGPYRDVRDSPTSRSGLLTNGPLGLNATHPTARN